MAFKSFSQYTEEKQGAFFVLPNDGDFADVVFLYRNEHEAVVADVHYLSTPTYSGNVHCTCTPTCPACRYPTKNNNGIRKDTKAFIPLYNASKGKVEFWDRSTRFLSQVIEPVVFRNYPNPSEYVFRITRHGAAGDPNTRYEVRVVNRNTSYPYDKIMSDFGITFPEAYEQVVKSVSEAEMAAMLNSDAASSPSNLSEYQFTPRPRTTSVMDELPEGPDFTVPTPEYNPIPEPAPMMNESAPFVADANSIPEAPADVPVGVDDLDVSNAPAVESSDDSADALDDVAF